MNNETAKYIYDFLEWINENLPVNDEDFEHYSNSLLNSQSALQDEISESKVFGVIGHVDHGRSALLHSTVEKLQAMGKDVIIVATDEINPNPRMIESEPFIIENLKTVKKPFYPKAKHEPKGHELPYKFHG